MEPPIEGDAVVIAPEGDHSWMVELHKAKVEQAANSVPGERDITVYRHAPADRATTGAVSA